MMNVEELKKAFDTVDEDVNRVKVVLPGHKPMTLIVMTEELWNKLLEFLERTE